MPRKIEIAPEVLEATHAVAQHYLPQSVKRAITLLEDAPLSAADLEARIPLNRTGVYKLLRLMLSLKAIHISGWRRQHKGPFVAEYSLGPRRAAPRPDKLTPAERSRRLRFRKKALNVENQFSNLVNFIKKGNTL